MSIDAAVLTIGNLARAAEVNVETVRYYQRLGLIQEPPRPREGYRRYPAQTVERIRFIKRAQRLGFSLKEIAELLELEDGHCMDMRIRAERKRARIDQQIGDLEKLRDTLDELIESCGADSDASRCPIVENLMGKRS